MTINPTKIHTWAKALATVIALGFVATIISCKNDDGPPDPDPDPQAEFVQKLIGTWGLSSATRDGSDVATDFQGLSVTFTTSGFSTLNGGVAWPSSGNWSFDAPPSATNAIVTFDGSISVLLVLSNNDQTLTATFTINETTFGTQKASSLAGNYIFVLNKN